MGIKILCDSYFQFLLVIFVLLTRKFVCLDGFSDLTPHADSLKFYVVSGGDGYIDFRLGWFNSIYEYIKMSYNLKTGDDEATDEKAEEKEHLRVRDMPHLLIWEIECPLKHSRKNSSKSDF